MLAEAPGAVTSYFAADAVRDIEAIVALFAADATVIDEGQTRHGTDEIRAWQIGPASKYEYAITIIAGQPTGESSYRVRARLGGNFPGATAELSFDFTTDGDRISRLRIAP